MNEQIRGWTRPGEIGQQGGSRQHVMLAVEGKRRSTYLGLGLLGVGFANHATATSQGQQR